MIKLLNFENSLIFKLNNFEYFVTFQIGEI